MRKITVAMYKIEADERQRNHNEGCLSSAIQVPFFNYQITRLPNPLYCDFPKRRKTAFTDDLSFRVANGASR